MKLNPTPQTLRDLFAPKKPKKPHRNRLPGEPRDFVPRNTNRLRNLTPPQHLRGGEITSTRATEASSRDPLWNELLALRAERDYLKQEVTELRKIIFDLTRSNHK
jgi:hypothetical protein